MTEKNSPIIKTRAIAGICLLIALTGFNSISTQFIAGRLGYHPALGEPLFAQFYNPFAWWEWFKSFYGYAPDTYHYAAMISVVGFFLSIFSCRMYIGFKTRSSRKHEGSHGTASFATTEQVIATGLIGGGKGVFCGGYHDEDTDITHYLRHDGPEHIAVFAPTRSGKGVGLIIPTLLSWPESIFVLDIKGENYAMTAGWRKKHTNSIVLRFDPANPLGSCAWNPLEEIRLRTNFQISDAQNIALMIIDDDGKGIQGNHFRSAAYELLVGIFLHALYKAKAVGRQPCLQDCSTMLTGLGDFAAPSDNRGYLIKDNDGQWAEGTANDFYDNSESSSLTNLFIEMRNVVLNNDPIEQAAQLKIQTAGQRFKDTPEKELGSIISSAHIALSLYTDTNVSRNTSRSDFKVSDLMDHDRPVSLYFITNPDDLVRMKPLARLLLTRIVASLAGRMEFDAGRSKTVHKHRLLMMLDEFPSLGKLDIFESALAYIAGYGIKAYIITQDVQQLYKAYSTHESIVSNCHVRIAFAPNKQETAEWLSKMTGQTTVIKEQISTSGKRFGVVLGQVSRSYQESQRPLMTADEISRLPGMHKEADTDEPGEMLVFMAGKPVIRGRQTPYFLDPTFSARSKIAPPEKSDSIRTGNSTGYAFP